MATLLATEVNHVHLVNVHFALYASVCVHHIELQRLFAYSNDVFRIALRTVEARAIVPVDKTDDTGSKDKSGKYPDHVLIVKGR